MPFEVYTGSRPGRPKAALLLSAAFLAATLALAWHQSREARALAPEQRVGDLPLYVRPPRNWLVDPEEPTAFILPVQHEGWRQSVFRYERRIRFAYERLPAYFSTRDLLRSAGLDNPRTLASLQRARIGRFSAVEVHHEVPLQIGRIREQRDRITRLTCLPNGVMLLVEYDALIDLRPADLEIIDDVCHSLRIDDPSVNQDAAVYLDRAGVELELDADSLAVGHVFAEVPGLFVGGTIDDWPAWSVGIFRTWLAPGRAPGDLLVDFAAQEWLEPELDPALTETHRADGARIIALAHPALGRADIPVPAVWCVVQSPTEAALLFVRSDVAHAPAAHEIARRIAESLRLRPLAPLDGLDEAVRAGRDLAEKLVQRGALPRWGREKITAAWQGESPRGAVRITTGREPRGPDASSGYTGWTQTELRRGERMIETTTWTLGPQARTYELQIDFFHGNTPVLINEQRPGPAHAVTRRIEIERRPPQKWEFEPSDRFVTPPGEEIVSWWVAYGTPQIAACEFSGPLTRRGHSVLLRQLPAPENRWRVLVQVDYWPLGVIETYDEVSDQPVTEDGPSWSLERVAPPPG